MRYIFEKNLRVMNEIITYCHTKDALDIAARLYRAGGKWIIDITAAAPGLDDMDVDLLREQLSCPRQRHVEESYWALGGELQSAGELTLAGMMVDEARVDYADGLLRIEVSRLD